MSTLSRDTIAMRREIFGALVAFVVGFVVMLAIWAWSKREALAFEIVSNQPVPV